MTDDASVPLPGTPGHPGEILSRMGELTQRVRAQQRDAWIPLLLFGLLTLGGVLADRLTYEVVAVPCPPLPDGTPAACTAARQGSPGYWTVGMLLGYAAVAAWSLRRSRRRGVGALVRPYVVAGVVAVAALAATTWWGASQAGPGAELVVWGWHLTADAPGTLLLQRFLGEAAAIGVPLLVLAWAERSRALLLFTAGYLVLDLLPVTSGWWGAAAGPWNGASRLGPTALYLLAGALFFGLAARRSRTPRAGA